MRTRVQQAAAHGLAQRVDEVLVQARALEAGGAVQHGGLRVREPHRDLKHAPAVHAADGVVEKEAQLERGLAYGLGLRRLAPRGLQECWQSASWTA